MSLRVARFALLDLLASRVMAVTADDWLRFAVSFDSAPALLRAEHCERMALCFAGSAHFHLLLSQRAESIPPSALPPAIELGFERTRMFSLFGVTAAAKG